MKRLAFALVTALAAGLFFIYATRSATAGGQGATGTESHGLDPAVLIGVAIMLVIAKLGPNALSAFGLRGWWGPLVPAALVLIFFRWLGRPPRHAA